MKPIRMCIVCRERNFQQDMNRFVCENGKVDIYKERGRSVYVCDSCINSDNLWKSFSKVCRKKIDKIEIEKILKQKEN